jgi:circadian clock protein KaiC
MTTKNISPRCETGLPGLDIILGGGLPAKRMYLVQGQPGTGKTTFALQFLLAGAAKGERVLYITFSETKEELHAVAESHGWDLSQVDLLELSAIEEKLKPHAQNTVFHPAEVEMNETAQLLIDEVERVNPSRVAFDSVSEMRMLAETPLRYRRQMLALKQFFSTSKCTVLMLDDLTAAPQDLQVQSIVHGVINLQKTHPEFGDERRRLNIVKVRGVDFFGGHHDYVIRRGGLRVFPRIGYTDQKTNFPAGVISSGIAELDALVGGGLDRGTSNLILGPAGTGKSTLTLLYAFAAAERGEHVAIYAFEESLKTILARTAAVGIDIAKHLRDGKITLQKIDPAELSPGEFASLIRETVEKNNTRMVVIDSLNGYLHAMPEEAFLTLQLHELFAYLGHHGVVTLLVLAQQGIMGSSMSTPLDITYLADTVLITRFFEVAGSVKKAVSVIKKRGGAHESTIREFSVNKHGINVGMPLQRFQGVLTGVPSFHGSAETVSEGNDGSARRNP